MGSFKGPGGGKITPPNESELPVGILTNGKKHQIGMPRNFFWAKKNFGFLPYDVIGGRKTAFSDFGHFRTIYLVIASPIMVRPARNLVKS